MNPRLVKAYQAHRRDGWWAQEALVRAKHDVAPKPGRIVDLNCEPFEYGGQRFVAWTKHDDQAGKPWDNNNTVLAEVKQYTRSDDTHPPGWVWLYPPDRRSWGYAYDRASALKEVRSWGSRYTEQLARLIVDQEEEHLRGWCNDQWSYCGVLVALADDRDKAASLWGIEDNAHDYLREVALELCDEVLVDIERNTYPVTEYGV